MGRCFCAVIVASAALAALVQQADAGQIAIVADMDTGIAQYDDAEIGPNTGLDQYTACDKRWVNRRMFIHFPLDAIPAGNKIDSAFVRVFRNDVMDDVPFSAYNITSQWTEGIGSSNGSPAVSGLGGWRNRMLEGADGIPIGYPGDSDSPTPWTTPGGDFDPGSRVSFVGVTHPAGNGYNWGIDADITEIARAWLAGPNYGVIFNCDLDPSDQRRLSFKLYEWGLPYTGVKPAAPGLTPPTLLVNYSPAALLSANPASDSTIDFGDVPQGTGKTLFSAAQIWNSGSGTIALTGTTSTDPHFSVVGNVPASLGSEAYDLVFSSAGLGLGLVTGDLTFVTDSGNVTYHLSANVVPIAEPAGLGLIGLALLALRKRRA